MLKVGNKAPAFTLPDQADRQVRLKDFQGQWVVLYFYPKDNTPGCTNEAKDFTALLRDFEKLNAFILGVSPDNTTAHRKFIEQHQLGVTLLCDAEKTVMKKYGAWGMKKNYGKEYEGVIRSTFLISPEGKLAEAWNNVKVRVKRKGGEVLHAALVRDKLAELAKK